METWFLPLLVSYLLTNRWRKKGPFHALISYLRRRQTDRQLGTGTRDGRQMGHCKMTSKESNMAKARCGDYTVIKLGLICIYT